MTQRQRETQIHVWALKVEGGMRGTQCSSCGTESSTTIDSQSTRMTLLALSEGTGVGVLWLLWQTVTHSMALMTSIYSLPVREGGSPKSASVKEVLGGASASWLFQLLQPCPTHPSFHLQSPHVDFCVSLCLSAM